MQNKSKFKRKFFLLCLRKAWFSYIVIHRRCPCGLIVGGQRWIKSFVFLKSLSPSAIPDNRSPMNCDIWKPGKFILCYFAYAYVASENQTWRHVLWIPHADEAIAGDKWTIAKFIQAENCPCNHPLKTNSLGSSFNWNHKFFLLYYTCNSYRDSPFDGCERVNKYWNLPMRRHRLQNVLYY